MGELLEDLTWRYATKKFSGDPVSPDHIDMIVRAIRLAPSSSGAQPYHIIVASGEMKDKLILSSGQKDKLGCSHLFVFCSRTDYPARAAKQIEITAEIEGKSVADLAGLAAAVARNTTKNTPEELEEWAARQTYIALGLGLAMCAELRIDACPMEGFKPAEFSSILELPEYMHPVVIMAVGHRDPGDPAQPSMRKKVRFPKEDLFSERA